MYYASLVVQYGHGNMCTYVYCINSVVTYMAIVKSQFEFIGGRGRRKGGGGRWGAEGRVNQPFGLKQQCCAFSV